MTISILTSALFPRDPQVLPSQQSTVLFSCHRATADPVFSALQNKSLHIAGYFYFSLTISHVSD